MSQKWDKRYVDLAERVGTWSKDPSSKIGAVVVGRHGQILSTGYNGFPRNIDDDEERYNDRETKYKYVVHAEMNCIYNASLSGVSLEGATMYVHGLPMCSECAKGVIQSGIKRVVLPYPNSERWAESWLLSSSMLDEAGVIIHYI